MTTVPQRAALLQERLEQLDCVFDKSFDPEKHPRKPRGESDGGQFTEVAVEHQVERSIAAAGTRQFLRAIEGRGEHAVGGATAAHALAHTAGHLARHTAGHLTREALQPHEREDRQRRLKKFHDMLLGRI